MPLTVLSGNPTGAFEEAQDSAFKVGNPEIFNIPAPASLTGSSNTLTAQQLVNGIIVINNATTTTATLPTATALAAVLRGFSSRGIIAGDAIYVTLVSGGAGAITITDSASIIHDANTSQSVPAGTSRQLLVRFTNGTPGSEAAAYF